MRRQLLQPGGGSNLPRTPPAAPSAPSPQGAAGGPGPFCWGVRVSSCTPHPPHHSLSLSRPALRPQIPLVHPGWEEGCSFRIGGHQATSQWGQEIAPSFHPPTPQETGGTPAQTPPIRLEQALHRARLQPPHHLLSQLPVGSWVSVQHGPLPRCPLPPLDRAFPTSPWLRSPVRCSSDSVTGPDTAQASTQSPSPLFLPRQMASWPGDRRVPFSGRAWGSVSSQQGPEGRGHLVGSMSCASCQGRQTPSLRGATLTLVEKQSHSLSPQDTSLERQPVTCPCRTFNLI